VQIRKIAQFSGLEAVYLCFLLNSRLMLLFICCFSALVLSCSHKSRENEKLAKVTGPSGKAAAQSSTDKPQKLGMSDFLTRGVPVGIYGSMGYALLTSPTQVRLYIEKDGERNPIRTLRGSNTLEGQFAASPAEFTPSWDYGYLKANFHTPLRLPIRGVATVRDLRGTSASAQPTSFTLRFEKFEAPGPQEANESQEKREMLLWLRSQVDRIVKEDKVGNHEEAARDANGIKKYFGDVLKRVPKEDQQLYRHVMNVYDRAADVEFAQVSYGKRQDPRDLIGLLQTSERELSQYIAK
jgi:hypothetical protein